MTRDNPPQTVSEALEFGWTHLSFQCRSKRCAHEGRIKLQPFAGSRSQSLAALFGHSRCSQCGLRPITGNLACKAGESDWREKRVDFYEGRVIRPSRE